MGEPTKGLYFQRVFDGGVPSGRTGLGGTAVQLQGADSASTSGQGTRLRANWLTAREEAAADPSVIRRFGFQWGVMVGSRPQSGAPA